MIAPEKTGLIAAYERLREEAEKLDQWSETVDAILLRLEKLLPDDYVYPKDTTDELANDIESS